jgi:glutamate dehydrogenase
MPSRQTGPRDKLLKAIAARGRKITAIEDLPIQRSAFLKHYYSQAELEDLARDPEMLASAALSHLHFAAARARGKARVRVFNPELKRDGWTCDRTVVQMINDDMPFLVDSATMTLNRLGHAIHVTVHPVLHIHRTRAGSLEAVSYRKQHATRPESFIHIEITREIQAQVLEGIQQALEEALRDVRAAFTDWTSMLAKLRAAAAELRGADAAPTALLAESCEFLDWLADDHFTLLGYREYELVRRASVDLLRGVPGTGLGLLRKDPPSSRVLKLRGRVRDEARSKTPIVITKANARSTVHRPALLDHVGVKVFDRAGVPRIERRFVGLFTSAAYSESPRDIPLLRHKVAQLMERSGLDPASHSGKNLQHVLDTFPRDDLFQGSVDDLYEISTGILALQGRHKVRLFCRRETFGRYYSCFVYLPRENYSAATGRRIEQLLLKGLEGRTVESEVTISESALARITATVRTDTEGITEPDLAELENQIAETVRTWPDRLRDALVTRLPEDLALELFHAFADAFSAAYREDVDPVRASYHVSKIALVHSGESAMEMAFEGWPATGAGRLRFSTFNRTEPLRLHIVLPVLENMGFKVISERPYELRLSPTPVWIQDFELETAIGPTIDSAETGARLMECFARVLRGEADNDGFNGFVISAGLDWREAMLLRAYCKYILQIGMPFSQAYMQDVLGRFPSFCRALIEEFRSAFDPDLSIQDKRDRRVAAEQTIAEELDRVASLDDDRILRAFSAVVRATLRTNFFQLEAGSAKGHIAFKLDPSRIPELPRPWPMFEIFVFSRRVEGVHLRCGKIARGGLRWSERREDFRTEVLGLMKTQQVKNTVIVPNGAKGGFFCKQLPQGDRDALSGEVISCYRTFVRGLLDLTDNIVDGQTAAPQRVLARDPPDPYLVVAADKGTATFSDIANRLSEDYGFWLGDAFASGGSAGYDHKKMAITARGAWEAVKRHFRELGIDTQREPFTVVGIGDMAGDVFGNGMLLSPHIRLVAAFNHQHIFIDPDPNPATAYRERERLFRLPRSTWDDYDRDALSRGGGIHSRQSKSIELSAEARALLGVEVPAVTPIALIRAILKAPVDLLWNGGIGTYVKASAQSHGEAGDPVNDSVRIDGNELQCRVVAEGGNLGFTQLGRIEYAFGGGRINADFIDNSGGVDSSDREVNIKILLDEAIRQRRLARGQRNALLAEMADDVAALVLSSNYGQTQALSMMASRAAERLGEHARLIRVLETNGWLDRALEFLPTEDQIEERRASGRGLTRPELAIILSYSKIELRSSLLDSDVPEDPFLASELEAYFPQRLARRFKPLIHRHKLARAIIAMLIGSSIVNRMGPFFVLRAEEETGANVTQVARAYAIAREVFGVRKLWRDVEALDYSVHAEVQYDCIFQISRMVRRAVYWFLQNYSDALEIESMVKRFRPGADQVFHALPRIATGLAATQFEADAERFHGIGFAPELAKQLASLALMTQTLDIIELEREFGLGIAEVGQLYFEVARTLRLDSIREQIEALKVDGRWRAMARATLRETLAQQQRGLVRSILSRRSGRTPSASLSAWLDKAQSEVAQVQRALDDMQTAGPVDFATLSVALKEVGRLVRG